MKISLHKIFVDDYIGRMVNEQLKAGTAFDEILAFSDEESIAAAINIGSSGAMIKGTSVISYYS